VRLKVDVIVTWFTPAAVAARQATRESDRHGGRGRSHCHWAGRESLAAGRKRDRHVRSGSAVVGKLVETVNSSRGGDVFKAVSRRGPAGRQSGRDFSAWIGLVPKQNSSGGKDKLGNISKQGDRDPHVRCCIAATIRQR
jgi:hypothetical protein